jgi:hypothetical protein
MNLVDPAQFYKGFDISYENKTIEPLVDNTASETLLEIWSKKFAGFSSVNMCLSGGIDSQFVLSMLARLEKNITVYIFSFVWEDCVFNAPDVIHAIRYCERFGYTYKNIEIDYKAFLEGTGFIEYCRQYKAISPQIALQLKMLDYVDNNNPIFLGGDVPFLYFDFSTKRATMLGIGHQPFMTYAFLNYAEQNNRVIIKELFRMCPKTHAISYKEFLNTTKKHKLVCPAATVAPGAGTLQPLRELFYRDLGAELIPPLLKHTGFELLKMHLAKKSGIYNQYDLKYRFPLQHILTDENWYRDIFNCIFNDYLDEIKSEFEEFCKTTPDIKPLEIYNFIL